MITSMDEAEAFDKNPIVIYEKILGKLELQWNDH